jgi:hypothetical protein
VGQGQQGENKPDPDLSCEDKVKIYSQKGCRKKEKQLVVKESVFPPILQLEKQGPAEQDLHGNGHLVEESDQIIITEPFRGRFYLLKKDSVVHKVAIGIFYQVQPLQIRIWKRHRQCSGCTGDCLNVLKKTALKLIIL